MINPSLSTLSEQMRIANPFERFMQTRREYPHSAFLEDADTGLTFTYSEAAEEISGITRFLGEKKIKAGDRVLIVADNSLHIPLLILAASRIGAIFSVLSPQIPVSGIREIVEKSDPVLIFCEESEAKLAELLPGSRVAPMSVLGNARSFRISAQESELMGLDSAEPAALVFTSGSTGDRKGIILSNENILFTAKAIQKRLQYQYRDRILVVVPFSFDYGLYQIFLAMESGACLLVARNRHAGPGLATLLAQKRVTIFPGVPSLIGALLTLIRRSMSWLPDLRAITNTGEHLPAEYVKDLQHYLPEVQIFPMYGITECKRISILRPGEQPMKPDSVGRCLDGTLAFVTDEERKVLKPHGTGELVVVGRHVTLGYWKDEEGTSRSFFGPPSGPERGFFTGDLCSLDPDGYIYFKGRLDSLIKNKGHRISSVEIEKEVLAVPGIVAAAALQDPSDKRLHLFVVDQSSGSDQRLAAICQALANRLEPYKIPDSVHFRASLPLNPNGKVDRPSLLASIKGSYADR